ncbi:MAG: hypothetical protein WEB37_11500 [Bacteroidota bacterium]
MDLPLIAYMAGGAIVVPFLLGLIALRKLGHDTRLLLAFFGFHSFLTVFQFALAFHAINNLWTSHIYYLVEMVVVLRVYSFWTPSRSARRIFLWLTILYAVFWIAAKFLLEEFTVSALYTPTVSRVIFIGSTLYILVVVATNSELSLYLESRFWFAAGFLVLFAGSLMFYAFRNFIFGFPVEIVDRLLTIHWTNILLSNLLQSAGFLCILRLPNTGGRLELAP